MNVIWVSGITGTTIASTREDAIELAGKIDTDTHINFSDIKFMSGAFADELINRLPTEQIDQIITSAPVHISKLFQAVRNRRVAA